MLFRNFTPFPPLHFESRDNKQNDFGVVVLRGTFQIEPGRRLRLVEKQEPPIMADQYFGEPGKSSLRFENSLAPYKPRTDLLINAKAHAPGGRPSAEWTVSVHIGAIKKQLKVTGPRHWERRHRRWVLSPAEAVTAVPVRYENAYGGSYSIGKEIKSCDLNPIGVGFTDHNSTSPVTAPQILPLDCKPLEFGRPIAPEGFGPIAPAWSPRRERAGKFDADWKNERWPDLPEDFSFAFYNTASSGLTLPSFATGAEEVSLINLSPNGMLKFGLPQFELATLLRFESGQMFPGPVVLDTIHVEVPESRAYLTWRGIYPLSPPLRVLEVHVKAPHDVTSRPLQVFEPVGAKL
jgi:hypothetical protein